MLSGVDSVNVCVCVFERASVWTSVCIFWSSFCGKWGSFRSSSVIFQAAKAKKSSSSKGLKCKEVQRIKNVLQNIKWLIIRPLMKNYSFVINCNRQIASVYIIILVFFQTGCFLIENLIKGPAIEMGTQTVSRHWIWSKNSKNFLWILWQKTSTKYLVI